MTDKINECRDIWPLQIILDRYGGVYSGAKWIAWQVYIEQMPLDQQSGDSECFDFWHHYDGFPPCGKGNTIQEAIDNLKENLNKLECHNDQSQTIQP